MGKGKAAAQVYLNLCHVGVWSVEDINAEIVINMTIPLQNKLMRFKSCIYWQSQGCYQQLSLVVGCRLFGCSVPMQQ